MQRTGRTMRAAIAMACGVVAMGIATAPVAEAQVLPWEDTGYVHINYGYQSGARAFAESLSETVYGETATYGASHASGGGSGLDIGGGVRVWGNLAAGVTITSFSNPSAATVLGTVPHPLFFNRPRTVAVDLTGFEYKELGVHLQAVWVMPLSEQLTVSVGGGPSFFSVDQDLLAGVTVGQETAPFHAVSIGASSTAASESAVGGNAGVDVTYMFTEQLGGGAFVRWTGGSLDLPTSGGIQSIDVGGVQSGAGLRVKF